MKNRTLILSLALAGLASVASARAQQTAAPAVSTAVSTAVSGAGSSFAAPLYGRWAEDAVKQGGSALDYRAIGSGGGQAAIFARQVDFGASDAPVPADKLRSSGIVQFPTAIGAVIVAVNVPGIASNQIGLTGADIAAIYMGEITYWDSLRIKASNPNLKLPHTPIAPVTRADASGTTFVFTSYLSGISQPWREHVGSGTSVRWPVGVSARGTSGVGDLIQNLPGSIGFVESAYVEQQTSGGNAGKGAMSTVRLTNAAGNWVTPSQAAFAATASHADWTHAQDFAVDLNSQPGDDSWPIETVTFALIPSTPTDTARARAVLDFFWTSFARGDEAAKSLHYIPLPNAVKSAIRETWRSQVHGPDGRPLC